MTVTNSEPGGSPGRNADGGLAGPDTGLEWQTLRGRWVSVYALQGGYAARRAHAVLREADRSAEAIARLVKVDKPTGEQDPASIYLLDPVAGSDGSDGSDGSGGPGGSGAAPGSEVEGYIYSAEATYPSHLSHPSHVGGSIVQVVRPESPGDPMVYQVVRLLLSRWFGRSPASEPLLVRGVAGLVAARLGLGPSVEHADSWVRDRLNAHEQVSVFGRPGTGERAGPGGPGGPGGRAGREVDDQVATSFFSYLVENFGAAALKGFLVAYDPEHRDQAAVAAFQRPLGALEEAWLSAIRRDPARDSVWGSFFRHMLPLLKPYRGRYLEVSLYMLLGLSYGVIMPLSGKYLLDTVIPSNDLGQLGLFVVGLLALYIANALLGMRRGYVTNWINQKVMTDLDERLFAHLQRLPHAFYAQTKVGDIVTRFTTDMQMVQGALTQVVGSGPYMALTAIFAGITVVALNPLLGGIVLVIVPLFALTYKLLGSRIRKASTRRQQMAAQLISYLQENVSAQPVVKAYGLEASAIAAFRGGLISLLNASLRLTRISVLFETSMSLAVTLGQLMVLGIGGYLVMQGHITTGTLLAFVGLLPSLILPISSLSNIGQTMQSASGAITRVVDLLEEPVTVEDKAGASKLPPLSEDIRLEGVYFTYGTGNPILNDLSLRVEAGTNVAIVGPSGSGKSTIVSLLLRFYDPEQGRVLFDGSDLRDVDLRSLRSQIGLVFQDTFIFDTTLRANISYGAPGATDDDVLAAARAARLDDYVASLPAGYDTVLGERGVRMSGGQRQRLAIARALVRNPRILIFDEATSALDSQTEREILETLKEVAKGRTVISITHRLAIAAMSDHIYVLERGRLVEEGQHAQLLCAGGLYARLYTEQMGRGSDSRQSEVALEQLRNVPLLAGLPDRSLDLLSHRLVRERYFPGESIVRQGDPGEKLYIIGRGEAEVLVTVAGEERRVNTLREGDYFGEMALLTGEARTATIRALEPCEVFGLERVDYAELASQEGSVHASVQATIDRRRAALALLKEVTTSNVPRD